jgi:hypothetical protein
VIDLRTGIEMLLADATRTGGPRAEQLARPVRRALDELQLALEPDVFSPATAERSFVVALDNFGAIALDTPVDRFATKLWSSIIMSS